MNLDIGNILICDVIDNSSWNSEALKINFGNSLISPILKMRLMDPNMETNWVSLSSSNSYKIVSSVYSFHNLKYMLSFSWNGWRNIWYLNVAPKVKFFIG